MMKLRITISNDVKQLGRYTHGRIESNCKDAPWNFTIAMMPQ